MESMSRHWRHWRQWRYSVDSMQQWVLETVKKKIDCENILVVGENGSVEEDVGGHGEHVETLETPRGGDNPGQSLYYHHRAGNISRPILIS